MIDKKYEITDLPDEYAQHLYEKGEEFSEKICKLLDEFEDKSVGFHCLRNAYSLLFTITAHKFQFSEEDILDIISSDTQKILARLKILSENLE